MCDKEADKDKETSSENDIKGKKNILCPSEREKRHIMVMFLYMNVVNTYEIQCMNARAQQMR